MNNREREREGEGEREKERVCMCISCISCTCRAGSNSCTIPSGTRTDSRNQSTSLTASFSPVQTFAHAFQRFVDLLKVLLKMSFANETRMNFFISKIIVPGTSYVSKDVFPHSHETHARHFRERVKNSFEAFLYLKGLRKLTGN
jgi:hypothetical protein